MKITEQTESQEFLFIGGSKDGIRFPIFLSAVKSGRPLRFPVYASELKSWALGNHLDHEEYELREIESHSVYVLAGISGCDLIGRLIDQYGKHRRGTR